MKKFLLLFISILAYSFSYSQVGRVESDTTIAFYGRNIVLDTTLNSFDYHIKITLEETFLTEKIKRKTSISKDLNIDSLKALLEAELTNLNINEAITLVEITDGLKIHSYYNSLTLLQASFELYVSNDFDMNELYGYLSSELPEDILIGFIATPSVSKEMLKEINKSFAIKANNIAKSFGEIIADSSSNNVTIEPYATYYPTYQEPAIPRKEYGNEAKIYINNASPRIKATWNYVITIKK